MGRIYRRRWWNRSGGESFVAIFFRMMKCLGMNSDFSGSDYYGFLHYHIVEGKDDVAGKRRYWE